MVDRRKVDLRPSAPMVLRAAFIMRFQGRLVHRMAGIHSVRYSAQSA